MKKLSVIVPIYNAEDSLKRCIESIIGQKYNNLEIILVDDGSTDNSLEICKEYAKTDDRIVVYHKENAGLVAARKSGVEVASGEYIGFVDSDDYIDDDMYLPLMEEAQKTNCDIAIGGITLDYPDHSVTALNRLPVGYYDRKAIEQDIIPNMLTRDGFFKFGIIPGVVVKVFKKNVIDNALKCVSDRLTIGEDVAITSYAVTMAESLSVTKAAGYHYIQTEVSMIRGYNPKRFDDICKMYDCISGIKNKAYKKQTGGYFACVLYGVLADCVKNKDFTKKQAKGKIKEILKSDVTKKAFKGADVKGWPVKDKIKFIVMKYRLVNLLTALL